MEPTHTIQRRKIGMVGIAQDVGKNGTISIMILKVAEVITAVVDISGFHMPLTIIRIINPV